jgi:hypothetical protein
MQNHLPNWLSRGLALYSSLQYVGLELSGALRCKMLATPATYIHLYFKPQALNSA